MHPLAQRLLAHIRRHELLAAGDRVGVAVSGGIDSVAMLRLLLELRFELGIVLSVVHFNHKLRGAESDADEEFVRNLAREHDLEFYVDSADVAAQAGEMGAGIEAAARELRYRFFRSLIAESPRGLKPHVPEEATLRGPEGPLFHGTAEAGPLPNRALPTSRKTSEKCDTPDDLSPGQPRTLLDKITTGHTLDDQAETVLMRIIRGAGMRGLGAIYPRIEVEDDDGEPSGQILRPLLSARRCELEAYLRDVDQSWREDSTNADPHFTRNRVRKLLVPLIEREFNPKIAEGLGELAEIAREEQDYWDNEIAGWMGTAVQWTGAESQKPAELVQIRPAAQGIGPNARVDRLWFLSEPVAVQRRLIRAIADEAEVPLDFKHVDEILRFAAEERHAGGGELGLPSGWRLLRGTDELVFLTPAPLKRDAAGNYEFSLPIPGNLRVNDLGTEFEAGIIEHAGTAANELDGLLAAELVAKHLTVRNWRAGDRFWPAHTKSPKKLKELLTDLHVAPGQRASWPVMASGDEIVWVRGFPVSARHRAKAGQRSVLIREIAESESEIF